MSSGPFSASQPVTKVGSEFAGTSRGNCILAQTRLDDSANPGKIPGAIYVTWIAFFSAALAK